jgi:NAD(P)H-dependent flavin oxidoreductase YrpB (nitropropane dioxygenase family)
VSFTDQLGLEHPIVQAGMGGGIATGELAGEVSAAGGLGTVGILPPPSMARELSAARERANDRPVAANLLVPFSTRAHAEACQKAGARVVVLHGGFNRALVDRLKAGGATVLHSVGTVAEARRALDEGAEGLVLQGIEAGGHLVGVEPALQALPPVLEAAAGAPVLLAGGIADRDDAERALGAGVAAVVAGTRFLLTEECAAHPLYKRKVLTAPRTLETQLFGLGWPMRHRVVPNAATDRWCRADPMGPRAVRTLQRATTPLSKLPMSMTTALVRTQRPGVPIFGPAAPLKGTPDELVEATALYAGETALRIGEIVSARGAVELLSPRSPTIST